MATDLVDTVLRLAVAGLGGLAVGVEREWSARQRERKHDFAGVRTFLLLGLVGGLSTTFLTRGWAWAGGVLFGAGALLALAAFVVAARLGALDATTEVAGLVVLAAGALAGSGELALASAICALTALVLMEKTRIHALVFKLRSEEIEAGLRFAVLALVVLPLLPTGPYGPPPGIRPREIWALVLIFSGVSFAAYASLRIAGPKRGYALSGLLGGLVSSTAVTLAFSRRSRQESAQANGLAIGILAACSVVCGRMAVVAAALAPNLGWSSLRFLLPPLLAGLLLVLWLIRARTSDEDTRTELSNPLALGAALQMALLFQVVLYAMHWLRLEFGSSGVLATAAVLGLTDVDALTVSMARLAGDPAQVDLAARALGTGLLSNTLLKAGLAVSLGGGAVRSRAFAGLLLIAAVSAVALLV